MFVKDLKCLALEYIYILLVSGQFGSWVLKSTVFFVFRTVWVISLIFYFNSLIFFLLSPYIIFSFSYSSDHAKCQRYITVYTFILKTANVIDINLITGFLYKHRHISSEIILVVFEMNKICFMYVLLIFNIYEFWLIIFLLLFFQALFSCLVFYFEMIMF